MSAGSGDFSSLHPDKPSGGDVHARTVSEQQESEDGSPVPLSTSGIPDSDNSYTLPLKMVSVKEDPQTGNSGKLTFARLASGLGLQFSAKSSGINKEAEGTTGTVQSGVFETLTKGIVDSSLGAVKAVQVKARHIVSQNKRRYQEGGFDLDMTYITENIIAMGFPGGDISSGFFGYVEGFYRNHMEEVIKFFETHHKGRYKVYNLCSERLYNSALFQGKVASFPFEDHNCPPIELISLFCQSAYTWLKEDIQNVVVVHCKAGLGRTGLMICSLLLFLKFFTTAEECIDYYNQKRCIDGKGITLPSQIRYVKYFERLLTYFNGENQPGRRCMLRGFRLHNCPYWIRPSITISDHNGILFSTKNHPKTKDLMPEDFWIRAAKKGIVVFALPGEPGLTELKGDFKIQFHDRHGDFYCWLNTTMTENRVLLDNSEIDGYEKRRLPSPGFQVEIVMIDYDGSVPTRKKEEHPNKAVNGPSPSNKVPDSSNQANAAQDNDDVFSDSDGEETAPTKGGQARAAAEAGTSGAESGKTAEAMTALARGSERLSLSRETTTSNGSNETKVGGVGSLDSSGVNDIKAMAADASVFSFGDDEDSESE